MLWAALATCLGWLADSSTAQAQTWVRAPGVRVGVGPGVYVRAPFVNLYVPSGSRYYYGGYVGPSYYYGVGPYFPGPGYYVEPRYYGEPRYVPIEPAPGGFVAPVPKVVERPKAIAPDDLKPPKEKAKVDEPPPLVVGTVTVDDFVKTFKPRAGNYEIDLVNPVTKKPTTVRFSLPEGTPKTVEFRGNTVEFRYGPLRYVRIEFDKDGAVVTSR
jgi:hypothetical protein